MANLTQRNRIVRAMVPVVAGQATTLGDFVDTEGYDGATFVALTGAITTTGTCAYSLVESTSTSSTGSALTSPTVTATTSTNATFQVNILEANHPLQRYIRLKAISATANVVKAGATCILSGHSQGGMKSPAVHGSTAVPATTAVVAASPTT